MVLLVVFAVFLSWRRAAMTAGLRRLYANCNKVKHTAVGALVFRNLEELATFLYL